MTAVDAGSYDQFFDAFEEFNFPKSESSANLMAPRSPKPSFYRGQQSGGPLGDFFRAVEQASFPLMPSSDSLVSLSSRPSMASSSAFPSQDQMDETFFQAVQNLIVTNSNSQAHFGDLTQSSDKGFGDALPVVVKQFIEAYNAFMHNPDNEDS